METTNETGSSEPHLPPSKGSGDIVPAWLSEDQFLNIVQENVPGFKKILKFDASPTGGVGENYASIMFRIEVKVQLEGRSTEDVAYVIKTLPQGEHGDMLANMMRYFPRETAMYSKYLPKFKQIYSEAGKKVIFGPKFFTMKNDPGTEYVLLEDLSPRGFKNVNRLEGLNKEHTEAVLRNLSELHAASAVLYQSQGEYDALFTKSMYNEENKASLQLMLKSMQSIFVKCVANSTVCAKYKEKLIQIQENAVNRKIKLSASDPNDFNVLNHGDLWANNIMFRHNDEGKLEETIFVDYQVSRYGSPAADLYYLLLSSTNLDLKTSHFDYFVKYYHDHLVENLKLLSYPKKIPSLKELHMQMLKHGGWAFAVISGIMAAILLDPTGKANIDNFVEDGEKGTEFKMQMYSNPRYVKHIEALLPWMDTRGLLDED